VTVYRTPLYAIAYFDDQQPLADLDVVSQEVATSLEDALKAGGIATPTVASLLDEVTARTAADTALSTRATALETARAARVTVTGTTQTATTGTPKVLTFAARTGKSRTDMWASANPTRLVAPIAGEYDLSVGIAWAANATGQRTFAYRISGGAWTFFHSWNAQTGAYGGEQTALVEGIVLTANQYVEVAGQQSSGGNLDTGAVRATLKAALL
jgi:hypothetical protein